MISRITAILLSAACVATQAAGSENAQVFGADPALAEGARKLQLGNYESGIDLTREGLESPLSTRDRASGYSNLCAGLIGLQKIDEALEACDKARELNRRNWRVHNNRALALLKSGRLLAAREALEEGLALNPDSPTLAKVGALIDAQSDLRVVASGPAADTH